MQLLIVSTIPTRHCLTPLISPLTYRPHLFFKLLCSTSIVLLQFMTQLKHYCFNLIFPTKMFMAPLLLVLQFNLTFIAGPSAAMKCNTDNGQTRRFQHFVSAFPSINVVVHDGIISSLESEGWTTSPCDHEAVTL